MTNSAMPSIQPVPEHYQNPRHSMGGSYGAPPVAHPPTGPTLQHIVTTGMVTSGTPTPSSATPIHSESPGNMDYYSPASTSYLPTPPLVPSHAHPHPGLFPRHSLGGPSNIRRASLAPSPVHDYSRRSSDEAYFQQRGSDGCRSSEAFGLSDTDRRGSDPAMAHAIDDGRIGVEDPCTERSYTELKVLGDGSFGTVWLCDWHSPVKPHVLLSAMQCGAGARPEWCGKRLVALKRMKRVFEGGWKQARDLGELQSLRTIPPHPAVIPLYDAFISPLSRELYFVFECMEGNLYQLTKSRKGRPLAAGLIASCFHQIVGGLNHIHSYGYFHRDLKPENLLVTTTGLCDYLTASAVNEINARRQAGLSDDIHLIGNRIQKDVQVIVKLADFGLARAINSEPPYTEYVSTRWYRAPEVLLRAPEYGAPVDMWALGTILAEMVNLKPLFPGLSEIDQVYRICETLGDPTDHGFDEQGRIIGGGRWNSGIKLAKNVGFSFPKRKPANFRGLFPKGTTESLIDCIAGLLRYNPRHRLNSRHCMDHPYFQQTLLHLQHVQPLPRIPFAQGQPRNPVVSAPGSASVTPSPIHSRHTSPGQVAPHPQEIHPGPIHAPMVEIQTPEQVSVSQPPQVVYARPPLIRADSGPFGASALVTQLRALDLPTDDLASYGQRDPSEERAFNESRRPSLSPVYNGSGHSSNPGYAHAAMPAAHVQHAHPHTNAHVAAYVQQQQQQVYEQQAVQQVSRSTPNLTSHPQESVPHVASHSSMTLSQMEAMQQHPHQHALQHHSPAPSPTQVTDPVRMAVVPPGKKKKWGLSSVFGGNDKHNESSGSLPSVDEQGYSGSSSGLKRTQSGHYADERMTPTMTLDPKMAKKIAEREKRELQKAKREAAARSQAERARAVLQKHQQFIEQRDTSVVAELDYAEQFVRPTGHPSMSQTSLSSASHRQHGVHPYGHDVYQGGRNKARKTTEDDDHSSIGRVSSKSRSLLSIGTVDSDPGPRRTFDPYLDPMVNTRRTPSHNGSQPRVGRSASSLIGPSHVSLESQLATQLARQATVASESTLSLGRRSGRSVSSQLQHMEQPQHQRGSEPTSPYGPPASSAVSHGHGVHRSGHHLPSIGDWAEGARDPKTHEINPMFRVPQQQQQPHPSQDQHMTLPPFSAIARVADAHGGPRSRNQ